MISFSLIWIQKACKINWIKNNSNCLRSLCSSHIFLSMPTLMTNTYIYTASTNFYKKNLADISLSLMFEQKKWISRTGVGKSISSCLRVCELKCFGSHKGLEVLEKVLKKSFHKSLLNLAYFWSRARLAIDKNKQCFSLPDLQLGENLILVFGFCKRTKKG